MEPVTRNHEEDTRPGTAHNTEKMALHGIVHDPEEKMVTHIALRVPKPMKTRRDGEEAARLCQH